MKPRLSIVTISLNQGEFIRNCVESIRAQMFSDYEHIVLDPGSTDGTREWLRSNCDPHMILVFEPDEGPADALNRGFMMASGEILMYLNADDELAPGAFEKVIMRHEEFQSADILVCDGWIIGPSGVAIKHVTSDKFSLSGYALGGSVILQQSTSFKRSCVETGLRFNPANRFSWDIELLMDAYRSGLMFAYAHDQIGYFRIQPNSITASGRYEAGLEIERKRLIREVPWGVVLSRLILAFRVFKYLKTKMSNAVYRNAPVFPGLARNGDRTNED